MAANLGLLLKEFQDVELDLDIVLEAEPKTPEVLSKITALTVRKGQLRLQIQDAQEQAKKNEPVKYYVCGAPVSTDRPPCTQTQYLPPQQPASKVWVPEYSQVFGRVVATSMRENRSMRLFFVRTKLRAQAPAVCCVVRPGSAKKPTLRKKCQIVFG
jgi:hypothetical protein